MQNDVKFTTIMYLKIENAAIPHTLQMYINYHQAS